ncbi:MAG: histidine phosphatase family protein [Thermoleophilia bacterium]|nr:histidine phosphatase family protein [Thermoleophilia bacterium]
MKVNFQQALTAPEGASEVVLVRHGACDPPAPDGLIGGRSDPALNERGRAEAAAAGERLAREPVAAVFVTHLRRTVETAAAILDRHPLEPVVVEDLGEIYLGEWEGHGIHDRGSRGDPELTRVFAEQRWDLIPGAEPLDDFGLRVRRGIETVADAVADGGVGVAVTHAAVIAEFCRQIAGSEPFAFLHNTNGSLTRVLRMPEGGWILMSFNDTEHIHAFRSRAGAGVQGDELRG